MKNDIMLFEEWKDSNDYLIQQWFLDLKNSLASWFSKPALSGFEIDSFDSSMTDLYSIYTAELTFNDKVTEYCFTFVLDADKVVQGQIADWNIECKTYAMEDLRGLELLRTVKHVKVDEWSMDYFVALVAECSDKSDIRTSNDE